jgi:hypothetical protein
VSEDCHFDPEDDDEKWEDIPTPPLGPTPEEVERWMADHPHDNTFFFDWSGAIAAVDAHAVHRSYEQYVEDQETEALRDLFFLHEMGIAPCEIYNDRILILEGDSE